MASPTMAKMMQPIMRSMMNKSMKVTDHDNDASYKEVQDFMVPTSSGKDFVDAPGTFKEGTEGRVTETGFTMCGVAIIRFHRVPHPYSWTSAWSACSTIERNVSESACSRTDSGAPGVTSPITSRRLSDGVAPSARP